jgi:hypothetical protein
MPRSIKRPQTGSIVWFYANANPPIPTAALVIKSRTDVDRFTFDLVTFDPVTGASAATLGVKYYDGGTRPASGQWCTHMRVQENLANQWPKDGGREAPLGAGGVAT